MLQKELQFKMGDVITVYGDVDYDGFYRGELAGRRGLVPSNFLRPAADAGSRPRHSRAPASPLPPPTIPDEASIGRRPPGLPEAPFGQPPIASPIPAGTSSAGQQRRPGDVPPSASMTGPPPAQPLSTTESRDLAVTSSPAYVGLAESGDERLRRSAQTFRR